MEVEYLASGKMFLLGCLVRQLLTNEQRRIRTFTDDESCSACTFAVEDQIHCLRDCPEAMQIWDVFLDPSIHADFFSGPFEDWFTLNVMELRNKRWMGAPWPALFGTICWKIWNWRCSRIMANENPTVVEKTHSLHKLIYELFQSSALAPVPTFETQLLHWDRPNQGWVKINCDGSWDQYRNKAGAGGVVRDDIGNWICGFSLRCGSCAIDRAELWGILKSMQIAWDMGLRRIVIESDSASSVNLIHSDTAASHSLFDLVFAIKELKIREWECFISYVPREKNHVADWFAKNSLSISSDLILYDNPPPGVGHLLLADSFGVLFPRVVRTV